MGSLFLDLTNIVKQQPHAHTLSPKLTTKQTDKKEKKRNNHRLLNQGAAAQGEQSFIILNTGILVLFELIPHAVFLL